MAGVALVGLGGCVGPILMPVARRRSAVLVTAIDGLLHASIIGLYGWLFLDVLPPLARVNPSAIHVGIGRLARAVGLSFGAPLAVPLCLHFAASGRHPVGSNHPEFAIALAVGLFGATHGAPIAATLGPLVEAPTMLGFAVASRHLRRGSK